MAVTAVYPALATSYGGTVIQANQVLLPASTEYERITWEAAQLRVKQLGGSQRFSRFPTSPKPDPRFNFYSRKDVVSAAAPSATLAAVILNSTFQKMPLQNTYDGDLVGVTKLYVEVLMWHVIEVTLTDTRKFNEVTLTTASFTALRDPETAAVLIATNAYQTLMEANGFLLKPVAAGAPLYDPFYASILGLNPNV